MSDPRGREHIDYDDKSDRITWDNGWARIGESEWSKTSDAGVVNRVPDWRRIRPSIDVSYRINKRLTLLADYTYVDYQRNRDRNADTEENILGGRIKLLPADWARVRLGYSFARREVDGAYQPAPAPQFFEWDQLRMFDQADRKRSKAYANFGLNPTDRLSVDFAFNFTDDDYDDTDYGLKEAQGYTSGIDVSYAISERATLFTYLSRDYLRTKSSQRSKSDAAGGGSFAVPENDWNTTIKDSTNSIGSTLSVSLIPDKLTLDIGAQYSYAKSEFDTSNPNFLAGTTTSSATAFDWPDMKIRTTKLRAELTYEWTEKLSTSIRYLYDKFSLDDFATDNVNTYPNTIDLQGNTLDYFIFMDSNYGDYRANLFTVTMSYEF